MTTQYVGFRRNSDGKYLRLTMINGLVFLQFTETDLSDKNVKHEIIGVGNGVVRIKSISNGLLWKCSSGGLVIPSGDPETEPHSDPNMLFLPVPLNEIGPKTEAYRCEGTHMFCGSRFIDGETECLTAASALDMPDIAKLQLVDIVEAAP